MPIFKIFPREGGLRCVLTGPIKVGDIVTLRQDVTPKNLYGGLPLLQCMYDDLYGRHLEVVEITKDCEGHIGYHFNETGFIYDFEMLQRVG